MDIDLQAQMSQTEECEGRDLIIESQSDEIRPDITPDTLGNIDNTGIGREHVDCPILW